MDNICYLTLQVVKDGKVDLFETNQAVTSNLFTYKDSNSVTLQSSITLNDLHYTMSMYEPDHFVATLNVKGNYTFAELRDCIVGAKVNVLPSEEEKGIDTSKFLSKNLFVYKATPEQKKGKDMSLTLDIYSWDKLLDLQKFNQAFTAKRLGKDVIAPLVAGYDKPNYGLYANLSPKFMKYILYGTKNTECEIIQPYMVQYNETFRSLINRVANRSGEFLYWHNGALQYGLADSEILTEKKLTKDNNPYTEIDCIADTIVESEADRNDFLAYGISASHRDGSKEILYSGDNDDKPYDLEDGTPDFIATCKKVKEKNYPLSELYTSAWDSTTKVDDKGNPVFDGNRLLLDMVFSLAASGGLKEYVTDFLTKVIVDNPVKENTKKKTKDQAAMALNHRPFEGKDTKRYNFNINEQTNYNLRQSLPKDVDPNISHFATSGYAIEKDDSRLDKSKPLVQAFYANIRKYGAKAERSAIDITMTSNNDDIHVGKIISFHNEIYIVTRISGKFETDANDRKNKLSMSIHAIPATLIESEKDNKEVDTKIYYIPAPIEETIRRFEGNTTAYITDVKDPFNQGRVRVRFSWQSTKDVQLVADELSACHFEALSDIYLREDDMVSNPTNEDLLKKFENRYDEDCKVVSQAQTIALLYQQIEQIDDRIKARKDELNRCGKSEDEIEKDETVKSLNTSLGNAKAKLSEKKASYLQLSSKKGLWSGVADKKSVSDESWKGEVNNEIKNNNSLKYEATYKDKVQNKVTAKETEELCKDSTPWIRMATPMAGKVNKFFMKPTEKTEVLVGFENGNMERPYVIGSLFNKDNKAGKDYSIMGANETGMVISDENVSWVDIASMAGLPVVKTIMSAAPTIFTGKALGGKVEKLTDPNAMPIGGKIEFKDKFGFYNMSMSSKDRKVSIKSAMGDISLSAFTGISISAPNGDVKINGKNVTITAGDKLVLKSGTNKDILDSTLNDVGSFIGGLVTKLLFSAATSIIGKKVVDLSLARSFWEVVFRPLNGTLQIHSNRHLLLEAGRGAAELPVDAMRAKKPESVVQVFPNYPYYLVGEVMKSVDANYVSNIAAVKLAFDNVKIEAAQARDKIDNVDIEEGAQLNGYSEKVNGKPLSTLSKPKFNHILRSCVKKDDKEKWILIDDEAELKKYCPYPPAPEDANQQDPYKKGRDEWENKVNETANKVADLANAYEAMNNLGFATSIFTRLKAAMQRVKSSKSVIKRGDLSDYSDYRMDVYLQQFKLHLMDSQKNTVTFVASQLFGNDASNLENYKNVEVDDRIQIYRRLLSYSILKMLFEAKLIKVVSPGQDILMGKKQYNTEKTFPSWDGNHNVPKGYETKGWDYFVAHCLPYDSVESTSAWNQFKSAVGKQAFSAFSDTVDTFVDYKNWDWMINQERNLWDAVSHPGMILMSDEKGFNTIGFQDGQVVSRDNHSLVSTIKQMKENQDGSPAKLDETLVAADSRMFLKQLSRTAGKPNRAKLTDNDVVKTKK